MTPQGSMQSVWLALGHPASFVADGIWIQVITIESKHTIAQWSAGGKM